MKPVFPGLLRSRRWRAEGNKAMKNSRRVLVCIIATVLMTSVVVLGTGEPANAQAETARLTCEVGELVGEQCVETGEPPVRGASVCPSDPGVIDDASGCYTLTPRPADSCPTGSTPAPGGELCRVPVDPISEQQDATCPAGFTLGDAPLANRCVQRVAALEAPAVCDPNFGQAGACYAAEPLLRVCSVGFLAGDVCVILGPAPVADDGGQPVCPAGFGPVENRCVRHSTPFVDTVNGPCQQGTPDAFGLCRVAIDDRVSEPQCVDPAERLEGDECVVRLPAGVDVCPTITFGFDGNNCVSIVDTRGEPNFCADGARGEANGCFILVAKGPAGEPVCFDGVLQGSTCVISFGPPPCPPFAGELDGDCVIFQDPSRSSPQCPVASFELVTGNCARPVADTPSPIFCESPTAVLNGLDCVTTVPATSCSAASVPDGFTFEDGGCVRVLPATQSNVACTGRTVTVEGECFAVIAAGQPTCTTGLLDVDENVCAVAARVIPQDPTVSCPDGFTEDDSLGALCTRSEDAVSGPACPDGARGEPGACYILVAKGPAPAPECFEGELVGSQCEIVGDPPVPGAQPCADDFALVDGQCVRFETPAQAAAQCPDGAPEDSGGNCRRPVDTATSPFTCPDPTSALNGSSCVHRSAHAPMEAPHSRPTCVSCPSPRKPAPTARIPRRHVRAPTASF